MRSLRPPGGFQHTAARRRLPGIQDVLSRLPDVSTHSRPKAAARVLQFPSAPIFCFNTQPPEGGCVRKDQNAIMATSFNTQPPEGGCPYNGAPNRPNDIVSTHSRPKAAAQPPLHIYDRPTVSTHSRPKAAANRPHDVEAFDAFQHTAARRRLPGGVCLQIGLYMFQHTAARRRLPLLPGMPS